jgi:hypothetical protein
VRDPVWLAVAVLLVLLTATALVRQEIAIASLDARLAVLERYR